MPTSTLLLKFQSAARYVRNPKLRRRLHLFQRAMELGNIARACREFQTSPQLYHYWWRRFQKSGFERESLVEKSRRPKRSPHKTSPQISRWICQYRKKFGHSGERIRRLLEEEKGVKISLPSIYRVLIREGLTPRKKIRSLPLRARKSSLARSEISSAVEMPAKIAGRYRPLRVLGSGSGGVVYLAEDAKRPETPLALKLLEIHRRTDPKRIEDLKNEFVALASLRHPHLAKVHDFGITAEHIFFTSDYIQGGNFLDAALGADLNLIFQWVVQILSALDFLHRKGILHLDLKPMNIMVTDPDEAGEVSAKIIDFGSADCRKTGQSAPGEVMGTPPYVAPEILMEQPPSPASDVYSLGILLHQVFHGALPFRETDPILQMREQIFQEPLQLANLPAALGEDFADLLHRMVARDPRQRISGAREVLQEINRCLGENFTLRAPRAPLRILEESEHLFHESQIKGLVEGFFEGRPRLIVLSGAPGSGKTRMLNRVKELLQLRGVFPAVFSGTLPEASQAEVKTWSAPLLLDGAADWNEAKLGQVLERLDAAQVSAVVTTRLATNSQFFVHGWLTLQDLDSEAVADFFQKEIADFPRDAPIGVLSALVQGSPRRLETLLQALQEEGVLQWTDRGWCWMAGVPVDFSRLYSSHEARWQERRNRVREMLGISPVGFSSQTLAGILGLPAESLEEKLVEWQAEGWLKSKLSKRIRHYFLKPSLTPTALTLRREKWEEELEKLYRQGEFQAGARLADLLLSSAYRERLTPDIVLACARHYAAAGEAVKALLALPETASELKNSGLYWEIRGRARYSEGDLAAALQDLQFSESEYRRETSFSGLSRVANLRGSLFKKLADFPRAEAEFQAAISQARAAGDEYLCGLAQMNLAIFQQEQGEFERASATYQDAMVSEVKAQHPLLSARLRHNWLNLIFSMGRGAKAEQLCYELLHLSLKHHYLELQAAALNFLALIAGQKNHRVLQLNFLNQAVSLLAPQRLWFPYTQSLLNRSFYYWEQKRFTPAELDARSALALAKRQKHPLFSAWAQLFLGRILRDRPRPDFIQAQEFFARARHGIYQAQNHPLFWELEFDLGLLAKQQGRSEEAREFFLAAQARLKELLEKLPELERQSYLRDRKMEKIEAILADGESR